MRFVMAREARRFESLLGLQIRRQWAVSYKLVCKIESRFPLQDQEKKRAKIVSKLSDLLILYLIAARTRA